MVGVTYDFETKAGPLAYDDIPADDVYSDNPELVAYPYSDGTTDAYFDVGD